MESLFKRRFWIVHFVAILVASQLLMRVASAAIEVALAPVPKEAPVAIAIPVPVPVPVPVVPEIHDLDAATLARLTGLPVPIPEPEASDTSAVDLSSEPTHTTLKLLLLGTLLTEGDPNWSMCSIQDTAANRTYTLMIGDEVAGAPIIAIERTRVIIVNNGRREFVDGVLSDGSTAPPPPVLSAVVQPSEDAQRVSLGTGIKKVSENSYEVPRTELDKTLSNLNEVAVQARIVPAFKDGKSQGFKLFSIRPDSIYSQIGVQNGDVIRQINGFDINSPEKALEIYSQLKNANRVEIQIDRNGATVNKTYNIR